jgi:hypothetical protein
MKNIKNAKSETSHSIVGGCMLLCEVSDFVRLCSSKFTTLN